MSTKKNTKKYAAIDRWRQLGKFIGSALQVARVRRKITQEELAAQLSELLRQDIRQSYVSKIENGHSSPSLERLGVICIALRYPPEHIMKIARFLAENEGRSNEELLSEILPDDAPNRARAGIK